MYTEYRKDRKIKGEQQYKTENTKNFIHSRFVLGTAGVRFQQRC